MTTREQDLAQAVWELAAALEVLLVLLRDSKRLDGNDYARAAGCVDRARSLAQGG